MSVIRELSRSSSPLTLQDLIYQTDISRSTLIRLVDALVNEGFVRVQEPGYELSYKLWSLASEFLTQKQIRNAAFPFMEALAKNTGIAVNLFVLEGSTCVHIETIVSTSNGSLRSELGFARIPALITASGRAILAYHPRASWESALETTRLEGTAYTKTREEIIQELEQIAPRGYATIDRELYETQSGAAVPLFTASSRFPFAAISIGWQGPLQDNATEEAIKHMRDTARAISESLGYHEPLGKLV